MSKISSFRRGAFLSSFLISLRESCIELLVLLHYSCRHALEERGCIAHWLAPTVEHRACKVWVNHWTLPQQPGPDSCLFWALSVDEVSGNSPVATNSTKHSTGEYLSLKMCIVFPSALLKIKSTSQHEGYSFFSWLSLPGKMKLPQGRKHPHFNFESSKRPFITLELWPPPLSVHPNFTQVDTETHLGAVIL